ncbi:MAG: 3-hydroxyacyl-CoA dehydrogenase [Candidatus Omnitrophica bacterium]|nr:3-hydroxyacyl-CoA dehydrogenase [Candidatus Omnitrophota bacterium]
MYIYKAGVVGAGTMGAEIAQVITYAGIPVVLRDINQELVDKGLAKMRSIYQKRVDKGKMDSGELEKKLALVSGTTMLNDFKDVDIVIEAVPEKMDLKKKVFQELESSVSENTIFATNTSALSISEIGAATKRPHKMIGMHFFFPAHVMKLVEIIPGLATGSETIDDVMGFTESLRKIPVRVNECAGFLVNRLLMPYLNEAAYALQEGAASVQEIDQAMVAFGLPMGPFTLVDNLGLDICFDVVKVLLDSYGNRMEPAEIWAQLYEAKRFGRKTGAGFYEYDGRQKGELEKMIAGLQTRPGAKKTKFSNDRLIFPMINEAALCVEERVAAESDIDMAMVAGIGFPQDKEGILHYADQVGLDHVLGSLESFYKEFGSRFFPAPRLRRMVGAQFLGKKSGRGFFEYST